MKSSVAKRSIVINGHRTSISLESEFWNALRQIATEHDRAVSQLVSSIDTNRTSANLSSAIRLFVLGHYQRQLADRNDQSMLGTFARLERRLDRSG